MHVTYIYSVLQQLNHYYIHTSVIFGLYSLDRQLADMEMRFGVTSRWKPTDTKLTNKKSRHWSVKRKLDFVRVCGHLLSRGTTSLVPRPFYARSARWER